VFFLVKDGDGGLEQRVGQRLQPVPGGLGLARVIFLMRALRSCSVRRRFFGSGEGSMTEQIWRKQ
jgi:hypothetical protein